MKTVNLPDCVKAASAIFFKKCKKWNGKSAIAAQYAQADITMSNEIITF